MEPIPNVDHDTTDFRYPLHLGQFAFSLAQLSFRRGKNVIKPTQFGLRVVNDVLRKTALGNIEALAKNPRDLPLVIGQRSIGKIKIPDLFFGFGPAPIANFCSLGAKWLSGFHNPIEKFEEPLIGNTWERFTYRFSDPVVACEQVTMFLVQEVDNMVRTAHNHYEAWRLFELSILTFPFC